jgi:electron transfer flavoprotein alpha/beta subunit
MTQRAEAPVIAVWLGSAAPIRSVRWLDGAVGTAASLGAATAVAAGDPTWLDLAADRATRAGLASAGVVTKLQLDYLGWAQVMVAVARRLGAITVLVDEASRPDRFAEVAAIAELLDAAQLTHVVELTAGDGVLHASRASRSTAPAATTLELVRVRGAAVIGVRIAGPAIDDYPTPTPSAAMRRFELAELGLDPAVLAHRSLAPRSGTQARRSLARIADHLAVYAAPPRKP